MGPRIVSIAITAILLTATDSPAPAQNVHVQWDDRGVPHVESDSDEGVFYGQGYAAATDFLAVMHRTRMAAQGRLAEYINEPEPEGVQNNLNAVEQDKNMRIIRLYEAADEREAKLDGMTRSALRAYAAGVNAYLDELAILLPTDPVNCPRLAAPLKSLRTSLEDGSFPRWTPTDSVACWEWWAYWFSQEPFEDEVLNFLADHEFSPPPFPVDEENTILQETDVDGTSGDGTDLPAVAAYVAQHHSGHNTNCSVLTEGTGRTFSHAWVLSKSRTANLTGAVLHADPQIPVLSPSVFHEIRLNNTSDVAGFNVRGVSFAGCPSLFLGFGEQIAWGATAFAMDTMDLIRVVRDTETAPTPGVEYYYRYTDKDGVQQILPLESRTESISGLGILPQDEPQVELKSTVFGPVITNHPDVMVTYEFEDGTIETSEEDFVLRSNFNVDVKRHSIQAAIRMIKATDVYQFREACKYWMTPSLHCVFADSQGDAGYTTLAAVPTRGDTDPYAGLVAVGQGDDQNMDWKRHVPFDLLPWSISSDGLFLIANQRPVGCWYGIPLFPESSSVGPTSRSLALKRYFSNPSIAQPTAEQVAEASFDAVNPIRKGIAELLVHLNEVDDSADLPDKFLLQEIKDEVPALEQWLTNGASSLVGVDDATLAIVMGFSSRIQKDSGLNGLIANYGYGRASGNSLIDDLSQVDYSNEPLSPTFDGLQPTNYDGEIAAWALRQFAAQINDPQTIQPQFDLAYFGWAKALGGVSVSIDPAHNETILLSCLDTGTLWSPASKCYSHSVDMDHPTTSGHALHPIGNHENPDHPTLAEHFNDSAAPIWSDGLDSDIFNEMEPAPLALINEDIDHPVASLDYHPPATYYGVDYNGADPQNALSIELVNPPSPIQEGDELTFQFQVPEHFAGLLAVGLQPAFVEYQDAILLIDGQPLLKVIPAANEDGIASINFTIPLNLDIAPDDKILFQGVFFHTQTPQGQPVEVRTSAGLAVPVLMN